MSVRLFSIAALMLSTQFVSPSAGAANVVELFTSHGCYSCPPADALLEELIAEDPDLVALEFHVDYWNDLVYGAAGRWVDPFSKREYTDRQRLYEGRRLKGRTGVYTPQMVVNGYYATVGSHEHSVRTALARQTENDSSVVFLPNDQLAENPELLVTVTNASQEVAEVVAVEFHRKKTTFITSGENKDLKITNHNIVTSMNTVALLAPGKSQTFSGQGLSLDVPDDESGCALLLQSRDSGLILAAQNCP